MHALAVLAESVTLESDVQLICRTVIIVTAIIMIFGCGWNRPNNCKMA